MNGGAEGVVFSRNDGEILAGLASRVGRAQQGVALSRATDANSTPQEVNIALRYKDLLEQLHTLTSPELLGLHAFEPDAFGRVGAFDVLTCRQRDALVNDVVKVLDESGGWQCRGADSRVPGSGFAGTQRRTFGVELSSDYKVVGRSEMPPPVRELGERLLAFCCAQEWPYSHSDVAATASFDQVYLQRYKPGDPASETMGYHFDSMSLFDELIVGVTLTGSGHLLLKRTNGGGDTIEDADGELQSPRTLKIPLKPLTFYALTGMSRYHLRHAVVCCGSSEERFSLTYRALLRSTPKGKPSPTYREFSAMTPTPWSACAAIEPTKEKRDIGESSSAPLQLKREREDVDTTAGLAKHRTAQMLVDGHGPASLAPACAAIKPTKEKRDIGESSSAPLQLKRDDEDNGSGTNDVDDAAEEAAAAAAVQGLLVADRLYELQTGRRIFGAERLLRDGRRIFDVSGLAISMRGASWSWACLHGEKVVENRSPRTPKLPILPPDEKWVVMHTSGGSIAPDGRAKLERLIGPRLPEERRLANMKNHLNGLVLLAPATPTELAQPALKRWACAGEVSYVIRAFCELPEPIYYKHRSGEGYGRPWQVPDAQLKALRQQLDQHEVREVRWQLA